MAGQRKRWWHVAFISGFFEAVAELVIRGLRTPPSPYRRSAEHPDGWFPDQAVTYQGLEDYVELLIPEIRRQNELLEEIIRLQYRTLQQQDAIGFTQFTPSPREPGFTHANSQ